MKNYLVKAIIDFNDIEEKNEAGVDTPRKANESIWNCTKERYEYLKSKNAVMLVGIDPVEENLEVEGPVLEEKKTKYTYKSKKSKKTVD